MSSAIFDAPGAAELTATVRGSRGFVEPLLDKVGLPAGLADAVDDTRWDEEIRDEGEEALTLTGRDVGTPIIHFDPPAGTAFFGPVISRLPSRARRIAHAQQHVPLGPLVRVYGNPLSLRKKCERYQIVRLAH